MRVAAIYDIHGNLPALEKVLEEIDRESVDEVVVGGDVVPGPMPAECLSLLFDLGLPTRFIAGNGEKDVLNAHGGGSLDRVPKAFHEVIRWVADQLSPEQIAALATWPLTCRARPETLGEVVFCHATPRDDNELFTRVTPEARLRPVFESTGAAVAICGHTHMQFDRRVGAVQVVNAGSVGMPFGDPGAYWALVGPEGVLLRRTEYDLAEATDRIEATRYPMDFSVLNPPPAARMLELFEAAALQ